MEQPAKKAVASRGQLEVAMRGKKGSLSTLIEKKVERAPAPDARPRWQEIHERLLERSRGVFGAFLEFAEAVGLAYQEKIWEHFGSCDPEPYFTEKIGIAPRTFRRYLRVENMLALLPADERGAAKEKLAEIGPNKAEVIAGVVERDPSSFHSWVEEAERKTREALEESVNQKLGLPARGGATDGGEPGEKFLRFILNQVPDERREQVQKIFRLIGHEAELRNPVAIFLWIIDIAARELADLGHPVE